MRYRPKTRPRRYQAEALRRAFECNGRYGLFLEPRTGKSKIAVDFAAALFQQQRVVLMFVLCQLSGHQVWLDELEKHCPVPYRVIRLLGGSKERLAALEAIEPDATTLTVVLLNYESSWRIERGLVPMLRRFDGQWVLVCDEGHKLKNRNAKQTKCVVRLVQALDPYRMLLTGTPIANSPLDIFAEFLVIDDSIFGRNYRQFDRRYATHYGYYDRQVRYKNIGDLRRRARQRATVLTKEECLDLPNRDYVPVYITLDKRTRQAYEEMAEFFVTQLEDADTASASIKVVQMLRLTQISGGFVTSDNTKKPVLIGLDKLRELKRMLEELIDAGEHVVVFARFRPEIDLIEKLCKKLGVKSFKYYGPVKGEREKYPQQFQKHNGAVVFIAQTQTGALSIDLDSAAYVIYYSFDYSLINWEQTHDRVLTNQKRPVTYSYLLGKNTWDEEVYKAMRDKKQVASILENNSLSRLLHLN